MTTPYVISDDSLTDRMPIIGAPEIQITLMLRELRRERTGMHGMAAIAEGGRVVAHDTFNIGRSEDRRRLAKAAHGLFTRTTAELVPLDSLYLRLDALCLHAQTRWETDRVEIVRVNTRTPAPARSMLLFPHVEFGASTIVFGVPGAGKSWLLALIAVSLATGHKTLWGGPRQTPVLYVDLERNQLAFHRRLSQIGRAMGQGDLEISYLRGKGMGLASLRRKLREWTADNPNGVLLYDSISRMGGGSLVEDETANGVIDMANSISETWVALGHSPRADAGHIFGSQLWDAGADMLVKMVSQHRDSKLGCALTVTKTNHNGKVPDFTFELEFDQGGLLRFGPSQAGEWPELAPDTASLLYALLEDGELSVAALARGANIPQATANYNLRKDQRLEYHTVGRETLWRRKTRGVMPTG